MNKPRICVFSIFDEPYSGVANASVFDNFKDYCDLYGYDLKYKKVTTEDKKPIYNAANYEIATAWFKIKGCLDLLETNQYDYVFFIDADCLFLNTTITLESFISENHFLVCSKTHDTIYGIPEIISSHMLFKNCEASKNFLREVWSKTKTATKFLHTHPWEQHHVNEVASFGPYAGKDYKINFKDGIKVLDNCILNSCWPHFDPITLKIHHYSNREIYEIGHFTGHFCGYPTDQRESLMRAANQHLSGGYITNWRISNFSETNSGFEYVIRYDTTVPGFSNIKLIFEAGDKSEFRVEVNVEDVFPNYGYFTTLYTQKKYSYFRVSCFFEGALIAKRIVRNAE